MITNSLPWAPAVPKQRVARTPGILILEQKCQTRSNTWCNSTQELTQKTTSAVWTARTSFVEHLLHSELQCWFERYMKIYDIKINWTWQKLGPRPCREDDRQEEGFASQPQAPHPWKTPRCHHPRHRPGKHTQPSTVKWMSSGDVWKETPQMRHPSGHLVAREPKRNTLVPKVIQKSVMVFTGENPWNS